MALDLRSNVRATKAWESPRIQLVTEAVSINKITQRILAKQVEQASENKMLENISIYGANS